MKIKYCWRCQMEVPMFNDKEFKEISTLYRQCMHSLKSYREQAGVSLSDSPIDDLFIPLRKRHEELTGWKDMHQNAIIHHAIALYGPNCPSCENPLRTPRAKLCVECGWCRGAK